MKVLDTKLMMMLFGINSFKFSNIWAIQYGTSNTSDEVEHRNETSHCSYADANLGDISQFSNKWDSAHFISITIRLG